MLKKIQVAQIGYTIISILFYLAAVLYLLFPGLPSLAVCLFVGMTLIATGSSKLSVISLKTCFAWHSGTTLPLACFYWP